MHARWTVVAIAAVGALLSLPATALGSTADGVDVSGGAWLDLDGDGTRDDGEPGRGDVQVTLRTATTILDATTSAADGSWTFGNVQPGSYTVAVEPPIDHVITGGTLPLLDTDAGEGTISVGEADLANVGQVGLGSPTTSGPDVTVTSAWDAEESTDSTLRWTATVHNIGSGDADGPVELRLVLSTGHGADDATGEDWSCDVSTAIVLCSTDGGLDAGRNLPPVTLTTTPTGDVGTTVQVTATARLDDSFDAAPLNDESESSTQIASDVAAGDVDGDGEADITNAGSTTTGLLVAALLALVVGATAVRTSRPQ